MNRSTRESTRILFTSWEGGGNVTPALTVARKLAARGHRVRFMSDEANRADARAYGLSFVPWKLAPNRPDRSRENCPMKDWEARSPQDGIGRFLNTVLFGPALNYARDVIAELAREPAELVVTSEMLPGVMAACESRGQRFALLSANLCLYPLPGMHSLGAALPPPQTDEEKALHQQIRSGVIAMFDSGLEKLNQARVALGLPALEHVIEQLDAAELYLLGTSRAFDFPVQHTPEKLKYVGPQLGEPAWSQPWVSPWPVSDTRPLVAVGFSTTFQNHAGVLQAVVDAAADLPVKTLVTLGQISHKEVIAADNAVLVQSAPHDGVMREAAVVITHGGHGTVNRALVHQKPLLIIPHGRDQDENAIRVTSRGAGLSLPCAANRDEIRRALLRLLEEPSFAQAARQLGGAIAEEAKNSRAVEFLEDLAQNSRANECVPA
jgi:MGT family glycosyltransferase